MKTYLVALACVSFPFAAVAETVASPTGSEAGNSVQQEEQQSQRSAEEAGSTPRQICRRIRPSNSYRSQRVCMTADEWRAFNEANR